MRAPATVVSAGLEPATAFSAGIRRVWPAALSRFRCRPGGPQVLPHELYRHRAFADRGRDPFGRAAAHVPGGEHAGQVRLQQRRPDRTERDGIAAGADQTVAVEGDPATQPAGARPRADKDEQGRTLMSRRRPVATSSTRIASGMPSTPATALATVISRPSNTHARAGTGLRTPPVDP